MRLRRASVTITGMNNNAANDSHIISFWTAEFKDPAMERAYQQRVLPDTVRFLKICVRMWAALLLVFILPDWVAMGASEGFYVISSIRVVNASALLILASCLDKKPQLASSGVPVTTIAILGYSLFLIYPYYQPDTAAIGFAIILLLLLSTYVFVPNRLMYNNLIALTGVSSVAISTWVRGATAMEMTVTLMILCWPAFLGYAASQRINTAARRAFILLTQSEQTNQQLEQEIAHRRELEVELQRQALTDPLTGLSNRRHYEMLFKREHERCRRHNAALTLGMIDLDHFKRINDNYGHDVGDQVLRFVAELLQQPLRQCDILGRFGGEEFILILPDTTLEQAHAIAERMRQTLEHNGLLHNGELIKVTATFALTPVLAKDTDIQECTKRADEALYEGKRAGRNRVTLAQAA